MILSSYIVGELPLKDWVVIMDEHCPVAGVPWRTVHSRFVKVAKKGMVVYQSCLDLFAVESNPALGSDETARVLYGNLGQLESVFRLLDSDRFVTI